MSGNLLEIEMFDQQYEALNFKTQFGAAIGGVQSGKTFVGSIFAGQKIQEFPDKNGLIVAPTYKILQQSTLDKFFQNFPQLKAHYNKSDKEIQLPTGGKVFCRSMEDPLSIEGITAHWGWGDEAGQWARLGWVTFRSRLSMTGGQGLLTTTPYNLGWLYTEFYQAWKNGTDKDLSVFTWASTDNPAFPKSFFEAERNRLSPEEFARRYQGAFSKMEGLIYNLLQEQIVDPSVIAKLNIKEIIAGVDWGFNNPAAIVILAITNDNLIYVIDEWYEVGKIQEEIEEQIMVFKGKYPALRGIYPDSAEPDRIESMKRRFKGKGMIIKTVDKNVELGINSVQTKINLKQFFVVNTAKFTLDEFEQYHYAEDKETPVKEKDHSMDAIKYAVYNYMPYVQPANPGVLGGVKPLIPGMPG